MNKNARRKHGGYKYDRAGRIIDGLIDNGRLVLMIVFCLSVSFMLRSMSDVADKSTGSSAMIEEVPMTENATPPDPVAPEPNDRIQERSDYRVELYKQCADSSYRELNANECEELNEDVDEALKNFTEKTIKDKSGPSDGGTYLDHDSLPIVVAIRTT